jgi:hypothetical protein
VKLVCIIYVNLLASVSRMVVITHKTVSSRLSIWTPKILFCTVEYTIRRVKFEIGDVMGDRMSKLLEIV